VSSYKRPEDSPVKQVLDRPGFAPVMMKSDFEKGDLIVCAFIKVKLEYSILLTSG
jgi:hypothetical protein